MVSPLLHASRRWLGLVALRSAVPAAVGTCLLLPAVSAGPVVCTTTFEAPPANDNAGPPVEVTTCAAVETADELIERRFFTWTAPYDRGVDVVHQITDLFGIALAGEGGTQVMGLGFPDQTIIWDAAAIGSTTRALLEEQGHVVPWRTRDLSNGFDSSLSMQVTESDQVSDADSFTPIQPLW